jgi:hypothetical protein
MERKCHVRGNVPRSIEKHASISGTLLMATDKVHVSVGCMCGKDGVVPKRTWIKEAIYCQLLCESIRSRAHPSLHPGGLLFFPSWSVVSRLLSWSDGREASRLILISHVRVGRGNWFL